MDGLFKGLWTLEVNLWTYSTYEYDEIISSKKEVLIFNFILSWIILKICCFNSGNIISIPVLNFHYERIFWRSEYRSRIKCYIFDSLAASLKIEFWEQGYKGHFSLKHGKPHANTITRPLAKTKEGIPVK